MNWFKRQREKRLRTKIALNASYTVNDLKSVQEFIEKGTGTPTYTPVKFTNGCLSSEVKIDVDSVLDKYFKNRKSTGKAYDGGILVGDPVSDKYSTEISALSLDNPKSSKAE